MVNKALFLQVAKKIENEPFCYDQTYACGSAMCIGGWANLLSGHDPELTPLMSGQSSAREFLGVSWIDAERLFSAYWLPRPDLTVPQALRMIADGASVSEVSA